MSIGKSIPTIGKAKTGEVASVFILVALILLRILYLGGIRLLTRPDYPDWLLPSEMILTYTLTAALIYLQRHRLAIFHITTMSLVLFLFAPLLEPVVSYATGNWIRWPYSLVFRSSVVVVAIVLSVLLVMSRKQLRLGCERPYWIAIGVIAGVILALAYGLYFEFQDFGRIGVRDSILKPPATISDAVTSCFVQLINAAIMEEPLFRGFLWGYLRKWGLSDFRILVTQTFLFWAAHIYYLGLIPFSFWILVPSAGIVFGVLAWRSRSIAPGLVAHSIVNGLTSFVSARTFYFWW